MNTYTNPELEVVMFESSDILTASPQSEEDMGPFAPAG